MIVLENLFGELIDAMLGIDPTTVPVKYILVGGHSIGFWAFIILVVAWVIACIFSKKFREKFF